MTKVEKQDMRRIAHNGENCIEFVRNSVTATVAFSQGKYVSKIRKLSERFPEECKINAVNDDGSIVATIPTRWIKISPPKQVSEEFREAQRERFSELHKSGKLKRKKNG